MMKILIFYFNLPVIEFALAHDHTIKLEHLAEERDERKRDWEKKKKGRKKLR